MDPEELQALECSAADDAAMCTPDTAIAGHDSAGDAPRRDALDQATSDLAGVDPTTVQSLPGRELQSHNPEPLDPTTVQSLPDDALQSHNPWPVPQPMQPLDHRSISSPSPEEHARRMAELDEAGSDDAVESTAPAPTRLPSPEDHPDWVGDAPDTSSEGRNLVGGINRQAGEHGPYLHADSTPAGRVLEFGVTDGAELRGRRPGDRARVDVLHGELAGGEWVDREGHRNFGARAGIHLADFSGHSQYRGEAAEHETVNVQGPSLEAYAYGNEDGAAMGFGANGGGADYELDSGAHANRSDDTNSRLGVGFGLSAATRLHWADRDNDGVREIGFGGDVGPLSGDLRSEHLGQAWNAARDWWNE